MLKCADCDESKPQWGSLNRGVVLCDECSSIHRHLGRHISQIKHLAKSRLRKTQLAMLKSLAQSGANKYWEHLIIESSLQNYYDKNYTYETNNSAIKFRKPSSNDSMYSTKTDFIKEKYLKFGFFKKPRIIVIDDLSQQLHATVRTGILEISLYLLALGANANFTHPLRRTTCLHVAATYNQPLQVELLLSYGADLLSLDGNGDTPLQIATKKCHSSGESQKWQVLITCLLEAQFEITDTLSYYLCRQTIDHSITDLSDPFRILNDFLIPKLVDDNSIINTDQIFEKARNTLQLLPNDAFIDLCLDICDEIDRRDTNDILQSCSPKKDLDLLFLPPNPQYSSTRNQGRQKLARLLIHEFRILCHDVLVEASHRFSSQSPISNQSYAHPKLTPKQSCSLPLRVSLDSCLATEDKDPVYDQVADDCDYVHVMDLQRPHDSSLPNPITVQKNRLEYRSSSKSVLKNKRISMPLEVQSQKRLDQLDETYVNSLLNQVDDLTGRNKLLLLRNVGLENKLKKLEYQLSQLKDERLALMTMLTVEAQERSESRISMVKSRDRRRSPDTDDDPFNYRDNVEAVSRRLKGSQNQILHPPHNDNDGVRDRGSEMFCSGPWLRQELVAKGGLTQSGNNASMSRSYQKPLVPNNQVRMLPNQPILSRNYDTNGNVPYKRIIYESRENSSHDSSLSSGTTPRSSNNTVPITQVSKHNMFPVPKCDGRQMGEYVRPRDYGKTKAVNEVESCVERIITEIRTLIDIANGRLCGDFCHCSKAINAAVQHLVVLFSGTDRRYVNYPILPAHISGALRDLRVNSGDLSLCCQLANGNIAIRGTMPSDRDTSIVIHHAHEIARAAQTLLIQYQYDDI